MNSNWTQAYEVDGGGNFQVSSSDLSGDGKSLLVVNTRFDRGSWRVYREGNDGSWQLAGNEVGGQQEYLSNGVISDDGNTVAISYPTGTKIYNMKANIWAESGSIDTNKNSGIVMSGDGNTIIEYRHDGNSIGFGGLAEVWSNSSGNWRPVGTESYLPYNGKGSIQVSDDGSIIALTSEETVYLPNGWLDEYRVGVYKKNSNSYEKIGWITVEHGRTLGAVSISGDGRCVAVHSYINSEAMVQVYSMQDDGSWSQNGGNISGVGMMQTTREYMSLSSDGSRLIVGDPLSDSNYRDSGQIRIYNLIDGQWQQLGNSISGEKYDDLFGSEVHISDNGNVVAAVAPNNDGLGTQGQGYAYIKRGHVQILNLESVVGSKDLLDLVTLDDIRDYDGNRHGGAAISTKDSYKYQGKIDLNEDGEFEEIYTNSESGRWATLEVASDTGSVDFGDYGAGGGTRVVGLYDDPLVLSGEVEKGSPHDSQVRFQNDLYNDNLRLGSAADVDNDDFGEVFWKTTDGSAFLRSIHHLDGNVKYANYMNAGQMTDYLSQHGHMGDIGSSLGL